MAENGSARPYMVLRNTDNGVWTEVEVVPATSAQQACRRATGHIETTVLELGVTLRAVPMRTWVASETRLTLERTTRLIPTP